MAAAAASRARGSDEGRVAPAGAIESGGCIAESGSGGGAQGPPGAVTRRLGGVAPHSPMVAGVGLAAT